MTGDVAADGGAEVIEGVCMDELEDIGGPFGFNGGSVIVIGSKTDGCGVLI